MAPIVTRRVLPPMSRWAMKLRVAVLPLRTRPKPRSSVSQATSCLPLSVGAFRSLMFLVVSTVRIGDPPNKGNPGLMIGREGTLHPRS